MLKKIGTISSYVFFALVIILALVLLGTMLPFAHYGIRIVESGSMAPTITTGSVIFISPADSYTVDDVVTFQRSTDKEVTTHRIIEERLEEGEEVFVTKGDANNVADIAPVKNTEVSGKVWGHIPYLGYVLNFFRQPIGFFILVVIPAVLVIEERVRKIIAETKLQKTTSKDTGGKNT